MPELTLMAYNIRHMNRMFENERVEDGEADRAAAIAEVIDRVDPHLIGISEAANADEEHRDFIDRFLGGRFRVASGRSRGAQNLVYYVRDPLEVESIDEEIDYYDPFNVDVDGDGVTERVRWERKPLEAVFRVGGARIRVILVHTKSKGVFDVVDLAGFERISLGNRKKLIAQADRLRERIEGFLRAEDRVPTVVLGDLNDGPGIDAFEQFLGRSFVETAMGSVFAPREILHNVLHHLSTTSAGRRELYTADFPDPIVNHPLGYRHRVWIDHILLSPDLLEEGAPVRYVPGSGAIDVKDRASYEASDHFAVVCRLEVD